MGKDLGPAPGGSERATPLVEQRDKALHRIPLFLLLRRLRERGRYSAARELRHKYPEADQKALRWPGRLSDRGAVTVQDREIEVAMRGASDPLAHASARNVVLARDIGDVDAALHVGDCREHVPCIMGLPR